MMTRLTPLCAAFALLACGGDPPPPGSGNEPGNEPGDEPGVPIPRSCGAPEPATNPGNGCRGEAPTGLTTSVVVSGLDEPVDMAFPPGDRARFFVLERSGRVRVIEDGALVAEPFLDISDQVDSDYGEQGLLGIALDPSFADNRRIWLNYITLQGQVPYTVVASVEASEADENRADPDSLETLFTVRQPADNHNGGALEFGPDGCLFVSFGDGGDGNDPWNNGQTITDRDVDGDEMSALLGSIARIDVENYPEPAPGNLEGDDVNPHQWVYGLRNPWRFSFDRDTGDLYVGDVGQGAWEEVSVTPAGTNGYNFGWKGMEGLHCRGVVDDGGDCVRDDLRLPVAEYRNPPEEDTPRSVIGGYVYRGSNVPALAGRYLYADYATAEVWSFVYAGEGDDGAEICDEYELTDELAIGTTLTSFGEDAAGELYVLTLNGRVLRIESE